MKISVFLLAIFSLLTYEIAEGQDRSFSIDYENNQFLKDGEPFRYVAGEMHYFRIPYQLWQDRLHKLRMGGLNAVQTYVEWSKHEPESGEYHFDGQFDLTQYLTLAQQEGLVVILRVGPYICAERDLGGFPYWLLREDPDISLRSTDSTYMFYVQRYLEVLLPRLIPMLYNNGGPVIGIHVENEYGSFACDHTYTEQLRDIYTSILGDQVVLFTTDGGQGISCGKIPNVYATVDFGTTASVSGNFADQRAVEPQGPYVNSEFYTGWLDHWGTNHQTVSTDAVTSVLAQILQYNASVSMYMYHGGTDFNLTSGANGDNLPDLATDPTSYDYDAPLDEAGDPTDKYYAIRDTIAQFMAVPNGTLPQPSGKLAFGPVTLSSTGTIFDHLTDLTWGDVVVNNTALNFEELSLPYGFILYETTLTADYALSELSIPGLSDRAYVFINDVQQAILERTNGLTSTDNITAQSGDVLRILLENQGRVNYGSGIKDFKGLRHVVTLDGDQLEGPWNHYRLPMNNTHLAQDLSPSGPCALPAVFRGTFVLQNDTVLDTFLDPTGWGKGVAVLNDVVLGRYWPTEGPQVRLYVPGIYLNAPPATNTLVMVEFEQSNCQNGGDATVTFSDTSYLNMPV